MSEREARAALAGRELPQPVAGVIRSEEMRTLRLKDAEFEKEHGGFVLTGSGDAGKNRRRRIRCPKCAWEPGKEDRWGCTCGYSWNTFDTAALCPSCGFQWPWTQCLRCHQRSPHRDWYEDAPQV